MEWLLFWRKESEEDVLSKRKKKVVKFDKYGERKYKYLSSSIIRFYQVAGIISACVLIFTVTLALFNMNHFEAMDSGGGKENRMKLAGTTLFLADRFYHPNTNQAEFLFQIDRDPLYQKQPIEMVVAERKTKKELPSKILELSEEYVLVIVSDVPENWRELVIDMGEKELKIDTRNDIKTDYLLTEGNEKIIEEGELKLGTFAFSSEKTPYIDGKPEMRDEDYLRYYAHRQIEQAEKYSTQYSKDIEVMNDTIEGMEGQIQQLESDKKYQTIKQQTNTDGDIKSIRSQQEKLKEKIQETKLGIKQLEERVGKLQEWLNDHPVEK